MSDLVALRARLESLQRRAAPVRPWPRVVAALPAGCQLELTPLGEVAVRREWIPDPLVIDTATFSRVLPFEADDLSRPVFLDTETIGLSGGTGTVAFLVGLAWPEGEGIALAQFFLTDFDREAALLWAVGEVLRAHRLLVTYNGRCFDWPLLQTRLTLRRLPIAWPALAHLDLLGLTRRLFRPRLPDCALQTVEADLLHCYRDDDLPGSLIPARYFAWLRGAPSPLLEAVFAHNRQDVVTLAWLLPRLAAVLRGEADQHPLDRLGRARFLEARGLEEEALDEYRRLWRVLRGPPRGALGIRLARLLRRRGEWRQAQAILQECWQTQCYPYQAAIELAKLLEHQARDLAAARRLVAEALDLLGLAVLPDDRWRADLERRGRRLDLRLSSTASELGLPLTG